jgi:hypothetical protein
MTSNTNTPPPGSTSNNHNHNHHNNNMMNGYFGQTASFLTSAAGYMRLPALASTVSQARDGAGGVPRLCIGETNREPRLTGHCGYPHVPPLL